MAGPSSPACGTCEIIKHEHGYRHLHRSNLILWLLRVSEGTMPVLSAIQKLPPMMSAGRRGNEGVHFLDTDGIQNLDMSSFKTFAVRETIRLELRGEFFNALNLVNFGRPNSGPESAIFGRVTTALDPRIVNLAGKLIW